LEPKTALLTTSILHEEIAGRRRVTMDLFAAFGDRGEVSPFIRRLWEKHSVCGQTIIAGSDVPFLGGFDYHTDKKER
jgi:hypothetical protein